MATIGLSFGSATSGTGFDVTSTVTSILALESAIETPWKTQLATLQTQDTALSSLGTNLSSLATAVTALTSFDGVLAAKQGSSSDNNVLTLTSASSSASAGSHTVTVNSLAAVSSNYSDRITNASDTLSGSITLQIGSGTAKTLTLDSTTNTLATLAAAINSGSYGVTANVVTDTQGSRLSVVSSTNGAAGQITLSSSLNDDTTSAAVGFQQGQAGADASLVVDGLATTSASNTVTGAIAGVTFQLLESNANTTVQVQITNDNSSVESAFQSLVTAYNAVVSTLTTQEGKDSTGAAEPLYGSPTLATIQTSLTTALRSGLTSGSIKDISQLGLTLGLDGTLSLDSSTLDSVLNSNYSDVSGFLQASGSFGLGFSNTLNGLSATTTNGVIALALKENATAEAGITTNISNEDARLATEKTQLTTELNLANEILQSIPQQLNEQDVLYSAMSGYNTK